MRHIFELTTALMTRFRSVCSSRDARPHIRLAIQPAQASNYSLNGAKATRSKPLPQEAVPLHATSTLDRLFPRIKRQAGGVDLGPVLQRP
jgi:hypothetical protein